MFQHNRFMKYQIPFSYIDLSMINLKIGHKRLIVTNNKTEQLQYIV